MFCCIHLSAVYTKSSRYKLQQYIWKVYIAGLVQERRNSIANAFLALAQRYVQLQSHFPGANELTHCALWSVTLQYKHVQLSLAIKTCGSKTKNHTAKKHIYGLGKITVTLNMRYSLHWVIAPCSSQYYLLVVIHTRVPTVILLWNELELPQSCLDLSIYPTFNSQKGILCSWVYLGKY